MTEEIEDVLTELQYGEVFEQLKNLPTVIKSIRNQKDDLKTEKDNIVNELNHRENELLETVFIDALEWKEKKKLNNDESRKNYLELLKHKDSAYQISRARLLTKETELNKANAIYEECTNKLKSYLAMKDMVVARIELINEFKSTEMLKSQEKIK